MTNLLVIDTNKYSGNFERSLYKFLFAYENDDIYDSSKMISLYGDEIDPELKEWYEDNYCEYTFDSEYGEQPVGIWKSPDYVNNGYGVHKHKDDPEVQEWKNKWPAYQSVAIAFMGDTIPENIKTLIKDRLQEYVDEKVEKDLVIENVRVINVKKAVTETEIDF